MGYQTEFYGAFRIFPKLDPGFACRLNLWFNCRHYQRAVKMAISEHAANDISDITLFGTPGKHNEFLMPSFRQAVDNLIYERINPVLAPHLMGTMGRDYIADNPFSTATLTEEEQIAYNSTPENIPSLWSNIIIVNDPDANCSYLGWDQVEKSYNMETWFRCVINLLQTLNYTVDGRVCAEGEDPDDIWYMEVNRPADLAKNLEDFMLSVDKAVYQNKFDEPDFFLENLLHRLTGQNTDAEVEKILTNEANNGNSLAQCLLDSLHDTRQTQLAQSIEEFVNGLNENTYCSSYGDRAAFLAQLLHQMAARNFDPRIENIINQEARNGNKYAAALLNYLKEPNQSETPFILRSGITAKPMYHKEFMDALKHSFDAAKRHFNADAIAAQVLNAPPIIALPNATAPDEMKT